MTVIFRSMAEVTRAHWLTGLGISEDEIPDVVILEGSWRRAKPQKPRLQHLTDLRRLGFPDIFWGRYGDKKGMVWDALTAGRRFRDPMTPEAFAEPEISNKAVFDAALTLTEELA